MYPAVPPTAVTIIVPSLTPQSETTVEEDVQARMAGSVIIAVQVIAQPLPSLVVISYDPAANPEKVFGI